MNRTIVFFFLLVFCGFGIQSSNAQMESAKRSDFVSDASFWVGTYKNPKEDSSANSRSKLAKQFLASLSDPQKKKTQLSLNAATRRQWTNLPARPDADGIRIGELNKKQVENLCHLIRSLTSHYGFQKVRSIMIADDQLLRNGRPRRGFGTVDFSIVIFGKPSENGDWSLQIDGHHMGINFSMKGKSICLTPSFIGTQPKSYKIGQDSYSPFQKETGVAHQFVRGLSKKQKSQAIQSPRRLRIITGPGNDGLVPKAKGLLCKELNEKQRETLRTLVGAWVNILPDADAKKRLDQIMADLDNTQFSWAGSTEDGSDVSYTIQGPSLIIEYACQSLGGVPTDHLHSMIRNPKFEYAGQLKSK